MPMSATRNWPAWTRPGSSMWPGLGRKNVTVSSARTAAPSTAPVVPLIPLGRSTAKTGTPAALIASIIASGSPLTGRSSPAPNSASMIKAGDPIAAGSHGRICPFHAAAANAASPLSVAGSQSSMTSTSRPRAANSVAATKPSPPLLPRPAITRIDPSSARSIAASATAWPARHISSKPAIPTAIVSRSASLISAVVRTSMSFPLRLIGRQWPGRSGGPANVYLHSDCAVCTNCALKNRRVDRSVTGVAL